MRTQSGDNPIVVENARPGTDDWLLTSTAVDTGAGYRSPWIEGFWSAPSVAHGQTITLHVSCDPPSRITLEVFRMGYYGGCGARRVATYESLAGAPQPTPPVEPGRATECRWPAALSVTIPTDWLSGVYLGRLSAETSGLQSYVVFIVRDDRVADVVFQCSDFTWQAYNRWPAAGSLYDDGVHHWSQQRGLAVSFLRPYGKYCQIVDAPLSLGSGEFLLWEFPLAFWMEQHGYDVTYVSNLDTHRGTVALDRTRAFLSVGHDEYYTRAMYDRLVDAVASGVSVGFFSANTCSGVVDVEPGATGTDDTTVRRIDHFGPVDPITLERFPEMAEYPGLAPTEAALVGARSSPPTVGRGDWVCTKPDHWVFAHTGMRSGDRVPGLVGWEFHGRPAEIAGLEVVAEGPTHHPRGDAWFTATVYEGPHGNVVFNAATIWWADGVAEPPGYQRPTEYTSLAGPDPRIQQVTRNVLDRLIVSAVEPHHRAT